MSLSPGIRLGTYEIRSTLGAGGMGEVYRARDTTLGRDVALKILPDSVAHDSDRIARFRREAQVLAALNHPHIAAIYGVEESQGVRALVLELVEGSSLAETLAARAPRGLGLEETVRIARQITEALEAAHENGIIHRDLKPANIKLRPDGTVKVLDFGLAKALDPTAGTSEASQSPTLTSPAMTGLGFILGTAAYMSPEQARGLAVDRGADIWAFGCVLFEMLAGSRPFLGEDATETIAAIVRGEPEWSRLPAETPDSVRRVLRRCLEKDRKRRFADIRDVRLDLEEPHNVPLTHTTVAPSASRRRERLAWVAALALTAGLASAAILRRGNETAPATALREVRVEITTPPTTDPVSLALSPDGEKLVFVASENGRPQLWLRSLSSGLARPLRGTDGASFPFWSPDSRSVGFFTNEKVQRIDIDGGSPRAIAPAPVGAGGTWNRDGLICSPRSRTHLSNRSPRTADNQPCWAALHQGWETPGSDFRSSCPMVVIFCTSCQRVAGYSSAIWMDPSDVGCLTRIQRLSSPHMIECSLSAVGCCLRKASILDACNSWANLLPWLVVSTSVPMGHRGCQPPLPGRSPIVPVQAASSEGWCGSIDPGRSSKPLENQIPPFP